MIKRFLTLAKYLKKQKVLIVYGARQVGKTTLLNEYLSNSKLKYKQDTGDNLKVQRIFESNDVDLINSYAEGYELIAIDEAQQIKNIGMGLKILIDHNPNLFVVATGSSSFDLAQSIGEPLTGRKTTITLFPIAQMELLNHLNKFELIEHISDYLIYGSYPEVVTATTIKDKAQLLDEIVNSYLLKDILSLDRIRGSKKILDLLKLLAFQVGSEVSLNELSRNIQMDVKTVDKYLDLLEKAFVIKRLGSFSRNLRKEVVNKSKYYFLDNGIRNGIISQFNSLDNRNDIGQLFENFIVMERLKYNGYNQILHSSYFWRTYNQQEIDIVEEREGKLFGYEIKWSDKSKLKIPKSWGESYNNSSLELINKSNFINFVT